MSSFKPTHKTPDGEPLHSEGGKYWTKHAWDTFGDAYKGPVVEVAGFGPRAYLPPGNYSASYSGPPDHPNFRCVSIVEGAPVTVDIPATPSAAHGNNHFVICTGGDPCRSGADEFHVQFATSCRCGVFGVTTYALAHKHMYNLNINTNDTRPILANAVSRWSLPTDCMRHATAARQDMDRVFCGLVHYALPKTP